MDRDGRSLLEHVVREDWGRLIAQLLAQFRRLDLVEDALGDALEAASRTWTSQQCPDNPAGWLMTSARRRIMDRLRTEGVARRIHPLLVTDAAVRESESARSMADPGCLVEDDLLRLVLMCAHPALAPEAASALSLRLVLGVPTSEVARLFLVSEATMAARLTRAKKRIAGLLHHSRRDARCVGGQLVLLPDQDRSRWHHEEIAEARVLLARPELTGPITH